MIASQQSSPTTVWRSAVPAQWARAVVLLASCFAAGTGAHAEGCELVRDGFGKDGTVNVRVETLVAGLEVPWAIAFLPNGDLLVTERPGRLRLVRRQSGAAQLEAKPVATFRVARSSEGGLLGLALHPDFAANRLFYVYVTVEQNREPANQIERWRLSPDGTQAERDRVIFGSIRAASYHNGGRLRFGPDGMLYASTGDAGSPELSQDPKSPNGKLLRLTPDGEIPADNPIAGSATFLLGIRNVQGWDWPDPRDASRVWIADHGPSGEMMRRGHDEVSVARAGDNLGWPTIYACREHKGMITPALVWQRATPPGGAAIYIGRAIPEWSGSLFVATLESSHLHRIAFAEGKVAEHDVYLRDQFGRLREVIMNPEGELYVTTSNCDGRGNCPPDKDKILRITRRGN